ncbi:GNAT family N-acetyltransferase [Natronosporangium hydrolyticum]|uniref:GNAT family N-acetyltransferase n=1 Tax=Natronosporangium hydrolyticum TaxID=2811111 RepID=A0A895YP34_9ACTN|nr:GNAT family N-acetyltransferase [Natronosporangium hydrolyticum]QSB16476.1 GNAT family N-acetyltransferase [Natronosporangium hydrolyticum]
MALWQVRATVDDRPGFLAVLAASLALRSINILSVGVHVTEAGAIDDFLVDAPEEVTEAQLLAAIERGRGRDAWVAPAHAHRLVDAPTRALDLATLVVRRPSAVAEALAELLDASVTWQPATGPLASEGDGAPEYGLAGTVMRVPAPGGGGWSATRDAPDFTPAEYARAQALLALTAACADPGPAALVLPDGRELTVRRAGAGDVDAVRRMHDRCSPTTRHLRYLTGARGPTEAQVARFLTPAQGWTLLVETSSGGEEPAGAGPAGRGAPPGQVVAMANVFEEGAQAELALLVEDGWQRCGIGTALLRRSVRLARAAGLDALLVHSHTHNLAMQRTLRRLPGPRRRETDGDLVTVTLPLLVSEAAPQAPRPR